MGYTLLDNDGDYTEVQGSGAKPYVLKNTGGVISCSCPAWRNQSKPINERTCKHIMAVRGADAEAARTGTPAGTVIRRVPAKTAVDLMWAMLAETWSPGDKVAGWWYSEKLDGVRLLWDHERKCFMTRAGNIVKPPAWFVEDFPNVQLDGELWMGRGKFQEVSSLVRSSDGGDRWNNTFYMIFDLPIPHTKWEDRLSMLVNLANDAKLKPHGGVRRLAKKAFLLPQQVIVDDADLQVVMNGVLAKGGEGVMLKKPGSLYVPRRSPALLKIKKFHTDQAKIIAVLEGTGRFSQMMGALRVKNRQGAEFAVGSGFTDEMRRTWWENRNDLHRLTQYLDYQYQELDPISSVPRFPTFKKFRPDLTSL